MSPSPPLISVIITFLNGEKFLQEAIDRVFAQTHPNWELLLVDDGSRDTSTSLAKRYADQHDSTVRYLEHAGHQQRGLSATRNLGIHHAKGEYIAFLELDDLWLPQKLARQVALFETHPRANAVIGLSRDQLLMTGDRGNDQRDDPRPSCVQPDTLYEPPTLAALFHPLGSAAIPCVSDALMRRESVQPVGSFDEDFRDLYEQYADQAFWSKLFLTHPVFVAGDCWVTPRLHPAAGAPRLTESGPSRLARLFFLNWLGIQMLEQEITDLRVWNSFQHAISEFGSPDTLRHPLQSGDDRPSKWRLRVAEENVASLVFPPDQSDLVRVEITQAHSAPRYDIQLNLPHLRVKADHRFRITFRARADRPRTICAGLAKTESPWSGLGYYQPIELTPDWKTCDEDFFVESTEENARILFDLGTELPSVEIASVTLRSLPSGTAIEPDLSMLRPIHRYHMEQFFVRQANDIRGAVLEVGGGAVARTYGREHEGEIVLWKAERGGFTDSGTGRCVDPSHFAMEHFDSVILPHVLHSVQDVRKAVRSFYRMLKPAGVLLATFPGIAQTYEPDWGHHWAWTFTPLSVQRLFEEVFSKGNVTTQAFGNVPAMITLLNGLPREVLRQSELDLYEPGYEVVMTVRAVKPLDPDSRRNDRARASQERGPSSE